MKSWRVIGLSLMLLAVSPVLANSYTILALPAGDAQFYPQTGVWVTGAATITPACTYSDDYFYLNSYGYLQIGLAAVPSNETITSATLSFYLASNNIPENSLVNSTAIPGANVIHMRDPSANGDVTQGTWSQTDHTISSVFTNTTPAGWISVDVTSYIASDKAAGALFAPFKFPNPTVYARNPWGSYTIRSAESGSTYAPRLIINTVPEPMTGLLLASGIIALVQRKTRQQ